MRTVVIYGMCIVGIIIGTGVPASADIIKLKRGVSFEGKVIEEKDDAYVVELSVGVVQFKKEDVEDIEMFSQLDNLKMVDDWNGSSNVTAETEGLTAGSSAAETDDSFLKNAAEKGDLVRYKGRYITPEVYDIIKKEREIKERRYQFIEEQRRKQEADAEQERLKKSIAGTDQPAVNQNSKGMLGEVRPFGDKRKSVLSEYGDKNNTV